MDSQLSISSPPVSRRFTTLEGWHKVGEGVFSLGRATLVYNFAEQFDLDRGTNENGLSTLRNNEEWITGSEKPCDVENPFSPCQTPDLTRLSAQAEKPYHVYTPRQKWIVVALISAAGIFSGLSSNIYFPSLDAIARVSSLNASNRWTRASSPLPGPPRRKPRSQSHNYFVPDISRNIAAYVGFSV